MLIVLSIKEKEEIRDTIASSTHRCTSCVCIYHNYDYMEYFGLLVIVPEYFYWNVHCVSDAGFSSWQITSLINLSSSI